MDLSGHERHRLTQVEEELIIEAPGLERAFRHWSTAPLRAERVRSTVRAVAAGTFIAVAVPTLVLGVGVALLVLGVVDGRLALTFAGVVTAQFGPWLVARRFQSRRAGRSNPPLALR